MLKKVLTSLVVIAVATVAAPLTSLPDLDSAHAQKASLAGKKGKVRRRLPNGRGACPDAVREYIAASGHSAYASTPSNDWGAEGYICSVAVNRKSIKQAEALALRGCENGTKKWKYAYGGKCEIHASK